MKVHEVITSIKYELEGRLEDVITELTRLQAVHSETHKNLYIDIGIRSEYGEDDVYANLEGDREETPAELKVREDRAKRQQRSKEIEEKELLRKLKEKYEAPKEQGGFKYPGQLPDSMG